MIFPKVKRMPRVPQLLYSYKNYNIVRFGGWYLGVAKELGAINLADVLANKAPRPPATKFIVTNDFSSLQTTLEDLAVSEEPAELLYAYQRYNLLRVGQLYVAIAQSLGPVDVRGVLENVVARPPSEQFIVAHDVWSLKASVIYVKIKLLLNKAIPYTWAKLHV